MKSEIEVKFLDVNFDDIRTKLTELGAVCEQPVRLMRRFIVETPDMHAKDAFLRVRDEGSKVTMTYKQFDKLSVDGAKEIELKIDDFDAGVSLAKTLCPVTNRESYQESKRETWKLVGCEIVLDEWPWIKPYIEIEGESESQLREVAEKLGLSWSEAVFGDVMVAYRAEYLHLKDTDTVGNLTEVRFDDPLPELLKP